MAEHQERSDESTRLRRCIRDLVALTALPAVWMGCDALQTVESLADVLLGMLRLDFIYLCLRGKTAENELEVGRISGRPREGGQSRAIGAALASWLNDGSSPPSSLPDPSGGGTVPVTVISLGPEGRDGVLVAGRRDPHFPSEVDRLLLGVGVNQAAVLLQRKEAEEALKQSEEQFRLMVESVKDYAIFSLDLEGRVTSWNTGAERLFGYPEAEIVGRSGSLIYTPEDQAAGIPEQELSQAAATGCGEDERWHQRRDGSRLFVGGVVTAITGAAGNLRGFTKVARDITERKRAEEERERLLAAERQNSERLRKLAAVAARLTVAHDIASAMDVITEEARDLVEAHQAVASLTVNEDGAQAIHSVSLSEKYAAWRSDPRPPDGAGLAALVCRLNHPVRLTQAELQRHPAWRGFGEQAQEHPPMRGWLAAPLVGRTGRNLGLVQVADKSHGEFTSEDEAVLVQLARMASVAIENARLYEELRSKDRRKD